jgi:hypothetical protein
VGLSGESPNDHTEHHDTRKTMNQQLTQPMDVPPMIDQGVGTSPMGEAPPEVQGRIQGMETMEAPPDVQAQQIAETEFTPQYFYVGGLHTISTTTETWFHLGDFDWVDNFHFTVVPLDTLRSLELVSIASHRLSNGQVRYWAKVKSFTSQQVRFYVRAFQER